MLAERFARGLAREVRALARLGQGEIAAHARRLPRGDGDVVGEQGGSLLADIERDGHKDRGDGKRRNPGRRVDFARRYARNAKHEAFPVNRLNMGLTVEGALGS